MNFENLESYFDKFCGLILILCFLYVNVFNINKKLIFYIKCRKDCFFRFIKDKFFCYVKIY